MVREPMRRERPQGRLETAHVDGPGGPFRLTRVEHAARRFAPHFFPTVTVSVVESGRCRVMTPRGAWIAGPGSLLAFSPRELHWAQVLSDEPYTYRTAYLSADCLGALRSPDWDAVEASTRELTPVMAPSRLSIAFRDAHRDLLEDPDGREAAERLMGHARALLRSAAGPPPGRVASKALALVETAKAVLGAHIGRRVSLAQVADACDVTVYHLIRTFTRVTGLSPYSWLMVMRVNEARRLLDAGAPVSDAVHACCFSDQSHLTRVFKRTLGVPPGLYLRAAR